MKRRDVLTWLAAAPVAATAPAAGSVVAGIDGARLGPKSTVVFYRGIPKCYGETIWIDASRDYHFKD